MEGKNGQWYCIADLTRPWLNVSNLWNNTFLLPSFFTTIKHKVKNIFFVMWHAYTGFVPCLIYCCRIPVVSWRIFIAKWKSIKNEFNILIILIASKLVILCTAIQHRKCYAQREYMETRYANSKLHLTLLINTLHQQYLCYVKKKNALFSNRLSSVLFSLFSPSLFLHYSFIVVKYINRNSICFSHQFSVHLCTGSFFCNFYQEQQWEPSWDHVAIHAFSSLTTACLFK